MSSDGIILDLNPGWAAALGHSVARSLKRVFTDFVHPEDVSAVRGVLTQLASNGKGSVLTIRCLCRDDSYRRIEWSFYLEQYGSEFYAVGRDAPDCRCLRDGQADAVALIEMGSRVTSLQEWCRELTVYFQQMTGCEAVGVRLRDGADFPYYETRGFSSEFVLAENRLCAVGETGRKSAGSGGQPFLECMCGNILSGRFDPARPFFTKRGSFWTNSTTELLAGATGAERNDLLVRKRCNREGYESVALIPLRTGDGIVGLLQLNDKRAGRFTAEQIGFLEDLAGYVASSVVRFRADEALRESEAKYRTLADNATDIVARFDRQARFMYVSPSVTRYTGEKPEKYYGRTHRDMGLPPEECARWEQGIEQVFQTGRPFGGQFYFLGVDGQVFMDCWAGPELNAEGRVVSVISRSQDVTGRVQMERLLRESEERYRRLFEAESDAIFLVDCESGFFLDANPAAQKLYGYSREELLSLRASDISAEPLHTVKAIIEGIEVVSLRWHRRKDGTVFPVEITGSYFESGGGRYHVGAIRDISRRLKAEEALRESELLLRQAAGAGRVGLWAWNLLTDEIYFSPEYLRQMGYQEGEVAYEIEEWRVRVHPDDKDRTMRHLSDFLTKSRGSYEIEYRLLHKDGSYRWILSKAELITDDVGKPYRMLGAHVDITDRKLAEEALRESEQRYRNVVEEHTDFIVRCDPYGTLTFINDNYCRFFGKTREELLGSKFFPLVHPDDLEMLQGKIRTLSASCPVVVIESRVFSSKKELRWMQFVNRAILDGNGKIVEIQAIGRDITDLKDAEARLLFQSTILEQIGDAVVATDMGGMITYVNDAHCRLLRYKREDLLGQSVAKFGDDPRQGATQQEIIDNTRTHGGWGGEVVNRDSDGREILLYCRTTLIRDEKGWPVGIVGIASDITDRKLAEEALREAELKAKLFSQKILAVREEEKKKLSVNLHDEVGSMAVTLDAGLTVALAQLKKMNYAEALGSISQTRAALKREIVVFRKIVENLRPPNLEVVGLVGVLREYMAEVVAVRKLKVSFRAGKALPVFSEQAAIALYRVTQEAVTNIIKHARAGKILLNLNFSEGKIRYTIRDDGRGFDVKGLGRAKVFHLGIQGMRERVEALGGVFTVESAPRKGTVISIVLPSDISEQAAKK
ncbi:MAG: PAS domain S-box protein [Candidatus Omnitrophica bacterium]|nr:PAS domain S-box protein [Candidatus Omnitrophota bacterium]